MPVPHSSSATRWWRYLLLGLGIAAALLLIIGAAIYAWRKRREETAKARLVQEVLPSLGLVIRAPQAVPESDADFVGL